jgi:hypothetical protein
MQACQIYLYSNRLNYPDDDDKTWYVLSTMQAGEAYDWAAKFMAKYTNTAIGTPHAKDHHGNAAGPGFVLPSYEEFRKKLRGSFAPFDELAHGLVGLQNLKQGNTPIEIFNSRFKQMARKANITDNHILIEIYRRAINPKIAHEINVRIDLPTTAEEWYTLAQRHEDANKRDRIQTNVYRPKYRPPPPQRFPIARPYTPIHNQYSAPSYSSYPQTMPPPRGPDDMDVDNIYYPDDNYRDYNEADYYDTNPLAEDEEYIDYPEENDDEVYEFSNREPNAIFTPGQKACLLNNACWNCHQPGHFARECPRRRPFRPLHPSPCPTTSFPPQRVASSSSKCRPTTRPPIQTGPASKAVNAITMAKVASNIINAIPEEHCDAAKNAFSDF